MKGREDNNGNLEARLSRSFKLIIAYDGELSDDTYVERLITSYGQEIGRLSCESKDKSFQFWLDTGAEELICHTLTGNLKHVTSNLQKFSVRLLGECLGKNELILDTALKIVGKLQNEECTKLPAAQTSHLLEKILIVQDPPLISRVYNEVLTPSVWENLLLPSLRESVMVGATHYLKNVVMNAVVAFLTRMFEKLCSSSISLSQETLTEVILSLRSSPEYQTDLFLNLSFQNLLLSKCLNSDTTYLKNMLLVQHLIGENSDVNILFHLVVRDELKAQKVLMSKFQGSNLHDFDIKVLSSFKIVFEKIDQKRIMPCWKELLEALIDVFIVKNQVSNLSLFVSRLTTIKCMELQSMISEKVFRIMQSFGADTNHKRDLTLSTEQKLLSSCLIFFEQYQKNLGGWLCEDHSQAFWFLLTKLSFDSDLTIIQRCKILDLMDLHLSKNQILIDEISREQPILNQLGIHCGSKSWEVLDSFLSLLITLIRITPNTIPVDFMMDFSRKAVSHNESFVRASAIEVYFATLQLKYKLPCIEMEALVEKVFRLETEAVVRRKCATLVQKFDPEGKSTNIRSVMLHGLKDFDWEVKEEVLKYWSNLVDILTNQPPKCTLQDFIDNLIKGRLPKALGLATSDYELRLCIRAYQTVKKLKGFLQIWFPELTEEFLDSCTLHNCNGSSEISNSNTTVPQSPVSNTNRDEVMNEIMKLEEVNLIGMLFQTCPPAQIESEPIFFQFNDGNETDDAKLFVKTILFNLDIDTKIEELNQSEDAQLSIESLLDDILQSTEGICSMEGVDCF